MTVLFTLASYHDGLRCVPSSPPYVGARWLVPDRRRVVNSSAMGWVAFFVSSHGFGHAARACAVMAEFLRRRHETHFHLFTEVPRWFFAESLGGNFTYHETASDVGLAQESPLVENLDLTIELLDSAPFRDSVVVDGLGARLEELGCSLVMADISPLGLAVAAACDLPSVLIENFTWDWVYANYPDAPAGLRRHGREMESAFALADLRIQTRPVCQPMAGAVTVSPVARRPRLRGEDVRRRLGIPEDEPMILMSMGGVRWDHGSFEALEAQDRHWVVVPGGAHEVRRSDRLILLPFHTDFFHPDLVAACDVVVGKLGYSTVAEAYRSGAAFLYVARPRFPESPVLARFVERHMLGAEIEVEALKGGTWVDRADLLLEGARQVPDRPNGAEEAVEAILRQFESL